MNELSRSVKVVSHAAMMLVYFAASIAVGEKVKNRIGENNLLTLVLLLFGFFVSITWLVCTDWSSTAIYEPIVSTVAALVGIWELVIRPSQRRNEREEDAIEDAKKEKSRHLQILDRESSLNGLILQITRIQSTRRLNEAGTELVNVPFEQLEFLRLSTAAIESALQSGLFGDDREFIANLETAKLDFEQFNSRMTILQNQMNNMDALQRTHEHETFLQDPFIGRVGRFFDELDLAISSRRGFSIA